MTSRMVKGKWVCCVWERRLKPFAVKMVRISEVREGGISGGLAEVTLENGITFRGSAMKACHLFQDKARLAGALEAPTRANVLIFQNGAEAIKHLQMKGCYEEWAAKGIDFAKTGTVSEAEGESQGKGE